MNWETSKSNDRSFSGPLSGRQEIVLYILVIVSGILSLAGSLMILLIVRNSKRKKGCLSVYDRLLIGLSSADFVASCNWIVGAFLVPKGDRVWAIGGDATCNATAFVGVAVSISLLYSAVISLYYALLVCYRFRDDQLAGKIEIGMHLMCTVWPLVGYSVMLFLDGFGPRRIGLNCSLSDYPKGCLESPSESEIEEGQSKCQNLLASTVTSGIPAAVAGLLILFCNGTIFYHVRASVNQFQKKAFARWENATGFFVSEGPSTSNDSSDAVAIKRYHGNVVKALFHFVRKENTLSSESHELQIELSNQARQTQQVRAVMNQSLFYVGSMILVYIPLIVQMFVGGVPSNSRENESDIFVFLCFTTFLSPLQGIFNLIIFCRPTYMRIRRSFPSESRFQCFLRTLEAGTSECRGRKRNTQVLQLRPHPLPGIRVLPTCINWKNMMEKFRLPRFIGRKSQTLACQKQDANSSEGGSLQSDGIETQNKSSLPQYHEQEGGGVKIIQLDMMVESLSSSNSETPASEDESFHSPPDSRDVGNNQLRVPSQDRYSIDFDSSCIIVFSSTTSTVAA